MANHFPTIPHDSYSLELLKKLEIISLEILANDENEDARKCGTYLYLLATSPVKGDYLYFLIHEAVSVEMFTELKKFYNTYIHDQDYGYVSQVLDTQGKCFIPYFNAFQDLFVEFEAANKRDTAWHPFNILLWAFYMSLFSAPKRNRLVDTSVACLEKIN